MSFMNWLSIFMNMLKTKYRRFDHVKLDFIKNMVLSFLFGFDVRYTPRAFPMGKSNLQIHPKT